MADTEVKTTWYRNTETGNVIEVVSGSPQEKRMSKELRGDADEGYEPAYEKLSSAQLKTAQSSPEDLPGYPAEQEKANAEKAAADKGGS